MAKSSPNNFGGITEPMVEIHYYHLWKKDCGRMGHALDTEHVSVLIRASGTHSISSKWMATYWYAAAHEDTVCDASQISRASTLHAEDHGATVWISAGKHASFLNEELCRRGCGGDICEKMAPLSVSRIVNLGEIGMPMNRSPLDFIFAVAADDQNDKDGFSTSCGHEA